MLTGLTEKQLGDLHIVLIAAKLWSLEHRNDNPNADQTWQATKRLNEALADHRK